MIPKKQGHTSTILHHEGMTFLCFQLCFLILMRYQWEQCFSLDLHKIHNIPCSFFFFFPEVSTFQAFSLFLSLSFSILNQNSLAFRDLRCWLTEYSIYKYKIGKIFKDAYYFLLKLLCLNLNFPFLCVFEHLLSRCSFYLGRCRDLLAVTSSWQP